MFYEAPAFFLLFWYYYYRTAAELSTRRGETHNVVERYTCCVCTVQSTHFKKITIIRKGRERETKSKYKFSFRVLVIFTVLRTPHQIILPLEEKKNAQVCLSFFLLEMVDEYDAL